nr:hypothetical protein [uncultured Bacteroides sp.]
MNINDWILLITALGGIEGVKQLAKWWMLRRTDARKEDASVDALENENERKQIAWLEERIAQRDTKIDALYVELRQEQAAHLEEIHKRYEVELKLKEAEMKKCDVRNCGNRQPPSDY